ncbi:hypothetical protein [Streptomyces sp. NPDC021622]|uniref:hypothetical protein n=1 Tax=Streptomyces sp. NPDC021622 TaxID=3155013 RepID=UPI0033DE8C93
MGASLSGILGPVIGGILVAITTYWTTRQRARAEVRKLDAETDRTRAETSRILSEFTPARNESLSRGTAPKGWSVSGTAPEGYEFGIDLETFESGYSSSFIQAQRIPLGFATLMQMFRADAYHGSRVRFSAALKAEAVTGWAGLWMRVDGDTRETLAFDNMEDPDRRIKGTIGWRWYSIVLDIPPQGVNIAFGIILDGPGRLWIDKTRFDVVSEEVPVTDQAYPLHPANLDFSDGFE